MNQKADFLQNESIRIYSHNESNPIDSNRELECSTTKYTCPSSSVLDDMANINSVYWNLNN